MRIDVTMNQPIEIPVQIGGVFVDGAFEHVQVVQVSPDPYTGTYEVTPDLHAQVLATNGKTMLNDVVVQPIPSNYGRVTYDQTKTITVV